MSAGPVIGIDLGTTNTVVGVVKDGQAAALADEHDQRLLPSVVSFHPSGNVLVGRGAKERRLVDATNTIYSIKRLIGRSWDSEEVRRARERFPFEMREGPGQATLVAARSETYTLPEISAFVLRRAKAIAERALSDSVERAVITVPANFNDLQRAATKVAGRVAGLEVMRILNEPTAAALAYGYGRGTNERIAVYDFGGGTFDVTLLDLSENVFEVLATAGNTFLGGDDLDLVIAERMAESFLGQHRWDPRSDRQSFERLRAAAETVKIRLSQETDVTVTVKEVFHGTAGRSLDLTFRMTRAELDALVGPIVERTFEVVREALTIARLNPTEFDQILLVGGSTRIPLVRERVEEFFKRPVLGHISPDEVVAIGAAIQAAALTGIERRRSAIPDAPKPMRRKQASLRDSAHNFDPSTQPYGARGRVPTSPGLNPDAAAHTRRTAPVRPMVVQPPDGLPSHPSPNTQDRGERRRQVTGTGIGPPPATIAGMGPRGRFPTGPGLGPAADQARARMGSAPGNTLTSAEEAAREARRQAARKSSPSVRQRLPSVADAGVDLPLIGAEEVAEETTQTNISPGRPPVSTLSSVEKEAAAATAAAAAATALGSTTTEGSVPVFELDDSMLLDDDSQLMNFSQASPNTAQIRSMSAPASTEEVTQVGRRRVPSVDESALPIPGVLSDDEPSSAGTLKMDAYERQAAPPPFADLSGPLGSGPSGTAPMHEVPQPPVPPLPTGGGFAPVMAAPQIAERPAAPPLLVDVTPLSLCVETVGGYCDTIITRNTPVPCEETRSFATASDNQASVRVRVSQGESTVFLQNTLLGEVELAGLRQAPRGQVNIDVTFALDTDGILNVRARDQATGVEATTRVRLVGAADPAQVAQMSARQQAHNVMG